MSPMPNTITSAPSLPRMMGHIALTYITRPWRSWRNTLFAVNGLLLFVFGCLALSYPSPEQRVASLAFVVPCFAFAVFLPLYHWMQQMALPWARGLPRFALAQTLIVVPALLIVLGTPLLLTAHRSPREALDMAAILLAVAAAALWTLQAPWLMVGFVYVYCKGLFPPTEGRIVPYLAPAPPGYAVGLVLAAGLALAWGMVRIIRSHEESGAYRWWRQTPGRRPTPAPAAASSADGTAFAAWWHRPSDHEIALLAQQHTPWQKVRRWRTGLPNLRQALIIVATVGVLAMGLAWRGSLAADFLRDGLTLGGAFLPVFVPLVLWNAVRFKAPVDVLRPVHRTEYLRQQTQMVALTHAKFWLVGLAALTLGARLSHPSHDLPWTALFLISLSVNVFYFGLGMWLARHGKIAAIGLVLLTITVAAGLFGYLYILAYVIFLVDEYWHYHAESALGWLFLGSVIGAGLLLVWDAYRRWQRVELGLFA